MRTLIYQQLAVLGFTELSKTWQWIIAFMLINSLSAAILRKSLITATTRTHTVRHGKDDGRADFSKFAELGTLPSAHLIIS